ncbi:general secretion pathway protein H [Orenia metallireducens]|jgi:general secretion pathway protein H|uniref:General secretion pathway protein H n=1 Tax=Orenia metallireducens TaxID=1413210 RepID=A0A285GI26_9FIRM|nr:prepilin-type N-terminal cleavage/methylation domain-containing protein [Orenia metallireducens]PRX30488.1 general secretion pathway protein H [Orenia metallireducens]SNY22834.1 general secretion pathway protein H [Orenia metallireducens]
MLLTGKDAFTLIEVLVVVILIGIILGVSLPSFGKLLDSVELRSTSRKVIQLLTQLRVKAISEYSTESLELADDRLIYQDRSGELIEFSKGIKVIRDLKEDNEICFFADGSSSGGEFIVVTANNQEFRVKINPITGLAFMEGD